MLAGKPTGYLYHTPQGMSIDSSHFLSLFRKSVIHSAAVYLRNGCRLPSFTKVNCRARTRCDEKTVLFLIILMCAFQQTSALGSCKTLSLNGILKFKLIADAGGMDLSFELTSPDGRNMRSAVTQVKFGVSCSVIEVEHPVLWNAEKPVLYNLRIPLELSTPTADLRLTTGRPERFTLL